jgi:hypothetical protein
MFASFQAALAPAHNAGFQQGIYRRTYSGYFGGTPTWFATATQTAIANVIGSLNLGSVPTTTSYEFLGWFKAPYTETFTFSLTSDDGSQLWVGDNAKAGTFNAGNKLVVGGGSGTIALTKGGFYAFRLQYGNNPGPGSLVLTVSSPSLAVTSDLTGLGFFNPNTNSI